MTKKSKKKPAKKKKELSFLEKLNAPVRTNHRTRRHGSMKR